MLGQALVALAAIGFGLRVLFARLVFDAGIDPASAALLSFLPGALVGLPFVVRGLPHLRERRWRSETALALLTGVFMATGTLAYMQALTVLSVATATLIYFSYPFFVVILAWLISGDVPTPRMGAALLLILCGCAAVTGGGTGASPLKAILICFLAPLSYAVLLLLLAGRFRAFRPLVRMGLIASGACIVLFLAHGTEALRALTVATPGLWVGVFGLMVVSGLMPQLLVTVGVEAAGADRTSILGGLELVTALVVGWTTLQEPVLVAEVVGALLIGGAIILART